MRAAAATTVFAVLLTGCGASSTTELRPASHPSAPRDAGRVEVVGDCTHATIRPAQIIVTCADAGYTVAEIDYRSWTAHRATGAATVIVSHGRQAQIGRYPAAFTLRRPKVWHGGRVFSVLAVRYQDGKGPFGRPRETYDLTITWS